MKKNLIDLMVDYLEYSYTKKAKGSYVYDTSQYKYLVPFYEQNDINLVEDLKNTTWIKIIAFYKDKGLKNSTINKIAKFICTVFNYYGITNPLGKRIILTDDTDSFIAATREMMERIYKYLLKLDNQKNHLLYKLVIFLGRDTGLRRNEMLNLKFSDISYNPNIINARFTKSKKNRITSFSNFTKKYIQMAYKKHGHLSDYVLYSYLDDKKCEKDSFYYVYRLLKKDLKIDTSSHCIRKYFATDMYVKLDGDLLTVQKFLGHKDPNQTKVYVDIPADFLLKQYKKVIKN